MCLAALTATLAAACAPIPQAEQTQEDRWSGRLALQVDDSSAQSFFAAFQLQGNAERGRLTLFNPLGNILARVTWRPGSALLDDGRNRRTSDSLAALTQELTGSALPITALFAWLHGRDMAASGWQADLSALSAGRIIATRLQPLPTAVLRVVLDR
ncbi:MAG: outer membrane lipoprotein LolB [Comamonas sp.]|nr:outer membrane lipoprotein LolB [Comamonas sp.]